MFVSRPLLAQGADSAIALVNGSLGNGSLGNDAVPTFEAVRFESLTESWQVALVATIALVVAAFCWWMYRRDSVNLGVGYGWMLLGLRWGALIGMLCYWMQYEKRVDRIETYGSRVLLLVDTSASMGRRDSADDTATTSPASASRRIDQIVDELTEGDLIDRLRRDHEVHVLSFDQHPKATRIVSIRQSTTKPGERSSTTAESRTSGNTRIESAQSFFVTLRRVVPKGLWWMLGTILSAATLLCVGWLVWSKKSNKRGLRQIPGIVLGSLMPAVPILVLIVLIVQQRNVVEQGLVSSSGLAVAQQGGEQNARDDSDRNTAGTSDTTDTKNSSPDSWRTTLRGMLQAEGAETRLGDVLRQLIHDERNRSTSALIVFTDGGLNAGVDHLSAIKAAEQAGIPIFPVGIGSAGRQANVRLSDFDAPTRVFPDDDFTVTATVQSTSMAGRSVNIQLLSISGAARQGAVEQIEQTKRVKLGEDGEPISVKFVITPEGIGRKTYVARVEQLDEDSDAQDNEAFAAIEVIDRKLRILLFAGGPNREYRYLRNQLFRAPDVKLDVLLQTSPPGPGISQDADRILAHFPSRKEEIDAYDGIIAFDPDWRVLDAEQVDLLEQWVGEDAGGLIVAAGPVHTATWSNDPKAGSHMSKIRALYPVHFPRRGLVLASDLDKFRSKTPWRLELTRAGLEAPFLRIAESAVKSELAWSEFEGVYGYFPVIGHKAGATVYARYETPDAGEKLPVYFAGQFYGSGRVYYMGSGEMWRIRATDTAYFETYYTKLIRQVCEGRLLRGNRRGVLLLENRKFVKGQIVAVGAVVKDAKMRPLETNAIPLLVILPNGRTKTIEMTPHATRKGMYRGDFQARLEGNYQLELQIPSAPDAMVTDTIRVLQPDLENDFSHRHDAMLEELAAGTGGEYYVGIKSLKGASQQPDLASQLRDATRQNRVRGTPSGEWDLRWAHCLLFVITGMLFLEWIMRRLAKLA